MDGTTMLRLEGITKVFPGVKALSSVSLAIGKGEIHAIVGENGAGKSTLMNILSGVFPPDSGRIIFDGKDVHLKDPREAQGLGISMIHQELSLAPHLSVMENVFIGRLKRNALGFVDYGKMRKMCIDSLACLGIESIPPDTKVGSLSVSQRQLVEIAKALSFDAKVLVMDEPTSSLTLAETEMLLAVMRSLKASGVSVLFISHRLEEVFEVSDRITVLRDGCLVKSMDRSEATVNEVVSLMVGREFERVFARAYREYSPAEKPVLEVRGLTSREKKLKDISFKMYRGEILALTGLVGSGRTELLQSLFGLDKIDSGAILVDGVERSIADPHDAIALGIGLVPEGRKDQGLFLEMSVKENISMAHLPSMSRHLFLNMQQERKATQTYVDNLNIKTPGMNQRVKFLSGGNQQKAIIARWLMNNPRILFLDEPTHGVDIGAKSEIYRIVDGLAQKGMSVLFVSSELPEVLTLADRILVMHAGSIVKELARDAADQEEIMRYATNQI
ncbi:MAG: sugar ABC transporter ATP-binding protein [Treponema sp.]|nr:sugar ABC transporter ATP-binding protein [Treponema sp.]